jgi:hypothetical protein
MFPLLAVMFLVGVCCAVTASFLLDLKRADTDDSARSNQFGR